MQISRLIGTIREPPGTVINTLWSAPFTHQLFALILLLLATDWWAGGGGPALLPTVTLIELQLLIFCSGCWLLIDPLANCDVMFVLLSSPEDKSWDSTGTTTSGNAALLSEEMEPAPSTDGWFGAGATDPDFGSTWMEGLLTSFSRNLTQSSAILRFFTVYPQMGVERILLLLRFCSLGHHRSAIETRGCHHKHW